ncbi:unnamed protein product [Strongylus vulgaris]|uniref:Protein kinase domain-containing protein n=1 Tax=Strongylus vulgaris TaxID=40348 RepID=A0A3P7IYB2_STRVU|nr:unnamed protein product [Strongylus vulgaris]
MGRGKGARNSNDDPSIACSQLHEIGFIHRDVKPCNFAVSTSHPRIIHVFDFGEIINTLLLTSNRFLFAAPFDIALYLCIKDKNR